MSERFATEIYIGGEIKKSLIPDLIGTIKQEDLYADFWEKPIVLEKEEDLLNYLDNKGRLYFADPERSWGNFQDLEDFLKDHRISYDKKVSPGGEYDGEYFVFRPDTGADCRQTDSDGNIVARDVELEAIQKIVQESLTQSASGFLLKQLELINCMITSILHPANELPEFKIVEG